MDENSSQSQNLLNSKSSASAASTTENFLLANNSVSNHKKTSLEALKGAINDQRAEQSNDYQLDLWSAAQQGKISTIKKIFAFQNIDPNATDSQNCSALHWAAINNKLKVIKYLLKLPSINVNFLGGELNAPPIFWACSQGHLNVCRYLLRHNASPLIRDSSGYSILHVAVHSQLPLITLYIATSQFAAFGNTVDLLDSNGITPLMWAAYQGNFEICSILIRLGANVNMKDYSGKTPLHYAVTKGNNSVIDCLLKHGADPDATDHPSNPQSDPDVPVNGKSPRDLAIEYGISKSFAISEKKFKNLLSAPQNEIKILGFNLYSQILVFLSPFFSIPFILYIFSLYPWTISLLIGIPIFFLCHFLTIRFILKTRNSDVVLKSPYFLGILSSTIFMVVVTWIVKILPITAFPNNSINEHKPLWLPNFLFFFFAVLSVYFLYKSVFTNPGYLPVKNSVPEIVEIIDKLIDQDIFNYSSFCRTCLNFRPLRSKHCKECDRCVSKMDHHCPWTYNCVGLSNHKIFILFVTFLLFGVILFLILVNFYLERIFVLYEPIPNAPCYLGDFLCGNFQQDPFTMFLSIWSAINMSWILILFIGQYYNISRNITTSESLSGFRSFKKNSPVKNKSSSKNNESVTISQFTEDNSIDITPHQPSFDSVDDDDISDLSETFSDDENNNHDNSDPDSNPLNTLDSNVEGQSLGDLQHTGVKYHRKPGPFAWMVPCLSKRQSYQPVGSSSSNTITSTTFSFDQFGNPLNDDHNPYNMGFLTNCLMFWKPQNYNISYLVSSDPSNSKFYPSSVKKRNNEYYPNLVRNRNQNRASGEYELTLVTSTPI
ncbi:hypothetical protein BB560_006849 [Smittium megazygosporum]|uniref:Palmitoyltransferase n=1 Tax=Smittium megazygosporum TaxID=133381 RepID=A0A2T9Y0Z1_9FUNG|nr:hypothetical protein BB560_006849 [Smittium megazygosporum]